jgi:hypothetical protein
MPSSIIIVINNLKHNDVGEKKLLGEVCAVFCMEKSDSHIPKSSGFATCSEGWCGGLF